VQDELVALRSQVNTVKIERDSLAADMTALNANLEQAASRQKSLVQEFENSRPISDLTTVDAAAEADLQSAGIRTIGELAAADTATLTNLRRIDSTKINVLINDAKSRGKNSR
jgi:predicted flap endonuclease-1-like 5' DNA nuclease